MDEDEVWARLRACRHAVLGTIGDDGWPSLVPICHVVVGRAVFMPVDRVKPKHSLRLRRLEDLARRPRAALLAEHYEDEDWTRLWWVRIAAEAVLDPPADDVEAARRELGGKYRQYRDPAAVASVVRFDPVDVAGWAAGR